MCGIKNNLLFKIAERAFYMEMDIDLVFKIAAVGIIVAVLNQLLVRSGREEQAMMTTLAGLIVVLSMLVNEIGELFTTIKMLFQL